MQSRDSVLNDLVDSASGPKQSEGALSTVAGVAAAGLVIRSLLKKRPTRVSKSSKPEAIKDYVKALTTAKTPQQEVAAVVGILAVCANVLLRNPDLKDLGYRVMQVVQSDRFEDFVEG